MHEKSTTSAERTEAFFAAIAETSQTVLEELFCDPCAADERLADQLHVWLSKAGCGRIDATVRTRIAAILLRAEIFQEYQCTMAPGEDIIRPAQLHAAAHRNNIAAARSRLSTEIECILGEHMQEETSRMTAVTEAHRKNVPLPTTRAAILQLMQEASALRQKEEMTDAERSHLTQLDEAITATQQDFFPGILTSRSPKTTEQATDLQQRVQGADANIQQCTAALIPVLCTLQHTIQTGLFRAAMEEDKPQALAAELVARMVTLTQETLELCREVSPASTGTTQGAETPHDCFRLLSHLYQDLCVLWNQYQVLFLQASGTLQKKVHERISFLGSAATSVKGILDSLLPQSQKSALSSR